MFRDWRISKMRPCGPRASRQALRNSWEEVRVLQALPVPLGHLCLAFLLNALLIESSDAALVVLFRNSVRQGNE